MSTTHLQQRLLERSVRLHSAGQDQEAMNKFSGQEHGHPGLRSDIGSLAFPWGGGETHNRRSRF